MTHTTLNEKAAGTINSNGLHTDTTGADFPTTGEQGQDFKTLMVGFAQTGHALHRTAPKDGVVTSWAPRQGMVRYLPTIDAPRRSLDQIGGLL